MDQAEADFWMRHLSGLRLAPNRAAALAEAKAVSVKLTKANGTAAPHVVQALRDLIADLTPKPKVWR